ncbi:hypothetical protein OC861_003921 [Tilletia horrida]|nr:hypothetical protein OC861_003921 [Tilletia horrida]
MTEISQVQEEQLLPLFAAAKDARKFSYSPYSKFRVGAALLFSNGVIVQGANIENASYGGTICAERTAILKARTTPELILTPDQETKLGSDALKGQPQTQPIVAIAVATDLEEAVSPCGMCRQVLREFCDVSVPVYMLGRNWESTDGTGKNCEKRTLNELLPLSFGPGHLDLPRS